jgi:hypothetical protein
MAHILPRIALSFAKKERPKDSSDERERASNHMDWNGG